MEKIRIFTDGSCSSNPGPGGWAAIFNASETCKTLSGYEVQTTNNRMELRAVIESLIMLVASKSNPSSVGLDLSGEGGIEIYSDSAYVINAITKGWLNNWYRNNWKTAGGKEVKNVDLWEQYTYWYRMCLSLGLSIEFYKVKGHSGNTFNDMADAIAKEETEKAKLILEREISLGL